MVRKKGRRPTRTLWIFCEGKTEKAYFDKLKFTERISRLRIRSFEAHHKDADGIIKEAKRLMRHKDFHKGDLIFCVFDRDANTNDQLRKAKALGDDGGIMLSFSNPSFEYWILCHYGYFPNPFENDELVEKISVFLGEYDKSDSSLYLHTKENIQLAITNAEKIKQHHLTKKRDLISRDSNPLSLISDLIKEINKFKD